MTISNTAGWFTRTRVRRTLAKPAMTIAAVLALALPAHAAHLASPEYIPAEAKFVVSLPNLPEAYGVISKSPLSPAISRIAALPSIQNSPEFKEFQAQREAKEKQLGFSLSAESLLSRVVLGVDIAMLPREGSSGDPDLLVAVKFSDVNYATLIVKELEEEAKAAAAPAPAPGSAEANAPQLPPVQRQTVGGDTVVVLPLQGLWMCQKGAVVLFSSSGALLTKSLTTSSPRLEKSPLVVRGVEAMGGSPDSHLFLYGDFSDVAAMLPKEPASEQSRQLLGSLKMVSSLKATPQGIFAKMYVPELSGLDPAMAEKMKKLQPTEIGASRLIGASAMIGASANTFSGTDLYDQMIKQFAAVAQQQAGPAAREGQAARDLEKQVEMAEKMLGFKVREDLLASLGSEMAFVIDNVALDLLGGPTPVVVDATVAFEIKDRTKLDGVLAKLETFLTTTMPAMANPPAQRKGNATPVPAPTWTMNPLAVEGVTASGKVLQIPQTRQYTPGWAIVGNYVVFGSTEASLRHAVQAYSGRVPAMRSAPDFAVARSVLPVRTHSEFQVSVRSVVTFLSSVSAMFLQGQLQGEKGEALNASLDLLRTFSVGYGTSVGTAKGESISTGVLVFAGAAAGAEGDGAKAAAGAASPAPAKK